MFHALFGLIGVVLILGLVGAAIATFAVAIPVVIVVTLGLALLAAPVAILFRILRWGLR
jgi:hypothetical protein